MTPPARASMLASRAGAALRARRGATRLVAVAVLVVVALAGAGLGMATDRFLLHQGPGAEGRSAGEGAGYGGRGQRGGMGREVRSSSRGRGEGGNGMRDRFARELDLSPAQAARVDSIMAQQAADFRRLREEMQPRFDSLLGKAQSRLDSVLTPAQRDKLKDLREREVFGPRGGFGPPPRRPPPFR